MTARWTEDAHAFRLAENALGRLAQIDAVMAAKPPRRRPVFADLHAYAAGEPPHPQLHAWLADDAAARDGLKRIVAAGAAFAVPRLAAAASGRARKRSGEGCTIQIKPSRADHNQLYVIIELADREARPASLFVTSQAGVRRFDLPEAIDGSIQMLADAASPLIDGLQDGDAEIFLR